MCSHTLISIKDMNEWMNGRSIKRTIEKEIIKNLMKDWKGEKNDAHGCHGCSTMFNVHESLMKTIWIYLN